MNYETLYCPNRKCQYYGISFDQARLVKNGSTRGVKQVRCQVCGQSIALSYATAYFKLDSTPAIFETAIRAKLAEIRFVPRHALCKLTRIRFVIGSIVLLITVAK